MIKHAALFDLDGVLVDTEGVYYDFWADIDRLYPTGIDDFASYIKGSTLKCIMDYFNGDEIRSDIIRRLDEQERGMVYNLFDGVTAFLDQLREADIPCAIVTSSNEDKMHKLFAQNEGFADYFGVVVTDRQMTRSKPDPQGYLLAADRLGCAPRDCVVFEDSFSGLDAGRRSGACVVGLATTNSRESIADKADMVIDSFAGLSVTDIPWHGFSCMTK